MDSRPPLLDGERVLWESAPPRGLLFYPHDVWAVPFSFAWAGFALFWEAGVWRQGGGLAGWFARAWGMPFVAIGAYLVVGRFVVDAWVRRRQRYFVTDRRVMVVRSGWRGGVIAAKLGWLPLIRVTAGLGGRGTITFGPRRFKKNAKGRMVERDLIVPALNPFVQFIGIRDVATVHMLIERAERKREAEE